MVKTKWLSKEESVMEYKLLESSPESQAPVINLSVEDCKRGNLQKVMFENADTIKEFPLTVFRMSDVNSQLLQNQIETLKTRSDVKVRVGKRNCAGFRRSPKATLYLKGKEIKEVTAKDFFDLNSGKRPYSVEEFVENMYNGFDQVYSENNDDIFQYLDLDKLPLQWDLEKENGLDIKIEKLKGINTPEAYFGVRGSYFVLHHEDGNLLSLNWNVYGEDKVWYGIHMDQWSKLKDFLDQFKSETKYCTNYFRHKTSLFNVAELTRRGIKVFMHRQKQGDIVVTNGPHEGGNLGDNVAFAVNFQIEGKRWTNDLITESHLTACTASCKYEIKSLNLSNFIQEFYSCCYCSHTVDSYPGILKHLRKSHKNQPEMTDMICPYCPKVMKKISFKKIHEHIFKIHPEKVGPALCWLCRKLFHNRKELNDHIKHMHPKIQVNKSKRFQCTLCKNTFKYKYNGVSHVCKR